MNASTIRRRELPEENLPGEVRASLILFVATFDVLLVAGLVGMLLA